MNQNFNTANSRNWKWFSKQLLGEANKQENCVEIGDKICEMYFYEIY